jgi:hypothetical protein
VVAAACVAAALAVAADVLLTDRLSLLFDLAFVLICVAATLAVRPRDFFVVGVFPPLLMFGTVLVLALMLRGAVADPVDGPVQAVVSGLAHHAGGLVAGHALTLGILALRRLALRNAGRIRTEAPRPATRVMS